MERSDQVGDLVAALAAAQLEFETLTRDSKNPFYNTKYADLAAVLDAMRPALNKQGVFLSHHLTSDLDQKTAGVHTMLFRGEQYMGFYIEAPATGKAKDGAERFDVQTLGACWTYLRRYASQGIGALASEDDDGNALSPQPPPEHRATTPFPPPQRLLKDALAAKTNK